MQTSQISDNDLKEAIAVAKQMKTNIPVASGSDATARDKLEAKILLAGLAEAKDEGFMPDAKDVTARKAAIGVAEYLKANNVQVSAQDKATLVQYAQDFALKKIHGAQR